MWVLKIKPLCYIRVAPSIYIRRDNTPNIPLKGCEKKLAADARQAVACGTSNKTTSHQKSELMSKLTLYTGISFLGKHCPVVQDRTANDTPQIVITTHSLERVISCYNKRAYFQAV